MVTMICSANASAIQQKIEDHLKKNEFSGVVLLSSPKIDFHKAFGVFSSKGTHPIEINSIFPIASITKTLTSSIVLLELAKRNIEVTASVIKTINLPFNLDPNITFSDLLSHRSGINLYTDFNGPDPRRSEPLSRESFFNLINLKAGKRGEFSYNNGNYIVLEIALEYLTGKTFAELLKENILIPHEMTDTGLLKKTQTEPLVFGQTKQKDTASVIDYSWLGAGAGIYATTADLHKFATAFLHKKILPEKIISYGWKDQGGGYGFGWSIVQIDNKNIFFHEGGIDGFSTMLMIEPLSNCILIMLSNQEIDIDSLSKEIFKLQINH